MTKKGEENLLDHESDGIKELDNQLPDWWLILFLVTLIWGFFYWLHFTLGGGETQEEEYQAKMAQVENLKKKDSSAKKATDKEIKLEDLIGNKEVTSKGKKLYLTSCASCHGKLGEGSIGPNLTDNFWLQGDGEVKSLFKVVQKGVPEKGMPPWESMLSKDKIVSIVIFVRSLRGTNPPHAKEPQGIESKNL